ncbi:hypothetical protein HQ563_08720 [bacterium]|nr:hypothetical protein [bacterium]
MARYHAGGEDIVAALTVDASGNVYVTGGSRGRGYDYATVKYRVTVPISVNLLSNPGFESNLDGWTTDHGANRPGTPMPHGGTSYLTGSMDGASESYTYQTVDLIGAGFDPDDLDAGSLEVHFGGWQAGWQTQTDQGKTEIIVTDGTNKLLRSDLGWFYSNHTWVLKEGAVRLPKGARLITYGFYTQRFEGYNNDGYLDDAFLKLRKVTRPIRVSDGNLILQWVAFGGGTYFIEKATDLVVGDWTEVAGPITGTASSVPFPEDSTGYFRAALSKAAGKAEGAF